MSVHETSKIENWIARTRAGDAAAMDELFVHFQDRLLRLTRRMLDSYPKVRGFEQTNDVFQAAALRLHTALKTVSPRNTRHFFRLAAQQIRRELITLARSYRIQHGPIHAGNGEFDGCSDEQALRKLPFDSDGPDRLASWSEFHEKVAELPQPLREVFDLIIYQGMTHVETARVLGLTDRAVRDRWQKARLKLTRALGGQLPWA
jgi:RNA polymerase sigma factor (sigma-70 family)